MGLSECAESSEREIKDTDRVVQTYPKRCTDRREMGILSQSAVPPLSLPPSLSLQRGAHLTFSTGGKSQMAHRRCFAQTQHRTEHPEKYPELYSTLKPPVTETHLFKGHIYRIQAIASHTRQHADDFTSLSTSYARCLPLYRRTVLQQSFAEQDSPITMSAVYCRPPPMFSS